MRTVCGLDVHKDSVFLCILCETGEIIEKVFGVLTHQLRDMRRMMQSHGVSEVTMESTAVYWIPVWRVLELQRCNIRLSNYVSNTDTKSYKDVVRKLCEGVTEPEELIKEIYSRITNRHGRETILAALT